MPKHETTISIFVASPSDVNEERKALELIVQELNKTWSKNLNLKLELLKWETDVHPGFGNYPQEVINNQIDEDYDVFIAIFWSTIGSPTAKAESGTIEEFEIAYKKYIKDKDSIDIMLYFKDQAIPPSKMDANQLIKIQELKERLGKQGGLYSTFNDIESFEPLLRNHLSKVAQKWAHQVNQKPTITSTPSQEEIDESELDDDYGILDIVDIYEEKIAEMNQSIGTLASASEKLGNKFTQRSEELNSVKDENGHSDPKEFRKFVKLTSEDIDSFSQINESQLPILSSSRKQSYESLSKGIALSVEFEALEDLEVLEQSVKGMHEAVGETIKQLFEFKEVVSSFPKLTIHLNKSKRRAVKSLNAIIEELKINSDSAKSVLSTIKELKTSK